MRKNLFIATIAAALSLALSGPVTAQSTSPYKYNGAEYDLKGLGSIYENEPKSNELESGAAILTKVSKNGRKCSDGYVWIVIGAPNKDGSRHRNCVRNPYAG